MAEAGAVGAGRGGTGRTGIVTIYKSFEECIREIADLEAGLKAVPPRIPSGGMGPSVETFSMGYGEALAEIRRLALVKEMSRRKGLTK